MKKSLLIICASLIGTNQAFGESTFTEALTGGTPSADIRLRYETVDQDNALKDAKALTVRTRIGYTTGTYKDFSATVSMEDTRIVGGVDDYSVPVTGFKTGEYSAIADPEVTELDQGFISYAPGKSYARYGRQVIVYDNQRFVGHVGWRQDRQTFDGLSIRLLPITDLEVGYSYVSKRNRIFAEAADVYSDDHMLNVAFNTGMGKLSGYAYLLEVDNSTDNGLDSYGLRFAGKTGSNSQYSYTLEYATQESTSGSTSFDADYLFLEGSGQFGPIKATVGYEVLGSDDGAYGFSTPLATLHKFNGWTDQFLATPAQGLVDIYVSAGGKLAGGKWLIVYHDFSADESTSTIDDLGSEIDLLYARKFNKIYTAGIKYGAYSAGDAAAGKVDTDKLWVWGEMKF